MSHQHDEQEPAFKVVDRRRFDDSGAERPDQTAQGVSIPVASLNLKEEPVLKEYQRPAMTFSLFIQTLAHQAIMGLGLVAWPDSGLIKKDLVMAKETIDILLMLKEKTLNNLSPEEHSMFEGLLYQLQLAFVEVSHEPASKT